MIIGETPSERVSRESQRDDAWRASRQWAKLTGEPVLWLDEFSYDPRILARIHFAIGRRPNLNPDMPVWVEKYPIQSQIHRDINEIIAKNRKDMRKALGAKGEK